jgi:hypothetical protein
VLFLAKKLKRAPDFLCVFELPMPRNAQKPDKTIAKNPVGARKKTTPAKKVFFCLDIF